MQHGEGAGHQGGWDHSQPRHLSPPLQPVTHPTLDLINSFCRRSDRCWLPLDDGTLRCDAALEIAPQRHRQLTRQRHHGDAADTALGGADTVAVPDAQCAVGLVTQPQPGKLIHLCEYLMPERTLDALSA